MKKLRYKIIGMSCAACATSIDRSLKSLAGVGNVSINYLTNILEIEIDEQIVSIETIIRSVEALGYGIKE